MSESPKYRIRKWFPDKGFGFARPLDAAPGEKDRDVFVHSKALDPDLQPFARDVFPVMDDSGRPDFKNSPRWPHLYLDTESTDRGLRARRASSSPIDPGAPLPAAAPQEDRGPPSGGKKPQGRKDDRRGYRYDDE